LARRISEISEETSRDAMACLFSGTLEFNNMFASFKGEGTGAVRHMFSHHILKPERVPLEANPWGTPKSSGSFSTLYNSRLLRAQAYSADPFELRLVNGRAEKVGGLNEPLGHNAASHYSDFERERLYLSCGDSSEIDLPDQSVDCVITDPPFFDNVNYSQLADFFHVWQHHIFHDTDPGSTRSDREVQHQDAETFAARLCDVFSECHRVLKDDGLLAFTYHHSRSEGWRAVLSAILRAGFRITATQPVKAEMSVAQPKHQTKEPIDLDIIIVCRKSTGTQPVPTDVWSVVESRARAQVSRFAAVGRKLSRNDVRVILTAQLARALSAGSLASALAALDASEGQLEREIEVLFEHQELRKPAIA
jgi:SAM-dependent methyltransferase